MIEASDIYFFWVEEPLHVGSGSSTGVVDLPIQRERHSGFPIVQYSGVKGAMRSHCRKVWNDEQKTDAIFGPKKSEHAGSVSFTQMRIALFPVRTLEGFFAWITCPSALANLQMRIDRCSLQPNMPLMTSSPAPSKAWGSTISPICFRDTPTMILESSAFEASPSLMVDGVAKFFANNAMPKNYDYWKQRLHSIVGKGDAQKVSSHLVILNDADFTYFVEHCTTVTSRNSIDDETGIVKNTGLWTEESLPPETLLYTAAHISPPDAVKTFKAETMKKEIADALLKKPIVQMGGNTSVGCGFTRAHRLEG